MDSSTLMAYYLGTAIIGIALLYFIIVNAVKSAQKDSLLQQELTNKLLIELLKVQGVTPEKINLMIDSIVDTKSS